MTSRHTPAPWSEGEYRPDGAILPANCRRIYMPGNDAAWITGTNKEANARLITAAPDLLAALEASPHGLHADTDGPCLCSQCAFVRLRDAAIAKARGEL